MDPTPLDLPEAELALWCTWIADRCGLAFLPHRTRVLVQSLQARVRQRGMRSVREYYHHVVYHPAGAAEWQELLDLLLNRETSFFRHRPSFDFLASHVLPELQAAAPTDGLRLWSAGCSAGQEPYSLAMLCRSVLGEGCLARVSATDLSERALAQAEQGRYKPHEARGLPEAFRAAFLRPVAEAGEFQIVPALRAMVSCARFNLPEAATYPAAAQDVIFCQNVLIYFAAPQRTAVVGQLCDRLRPGGYLFLGPGELVGTRPAGVEPIHAPNVLVFRRPR